VSRTDPAEFVESDKVAAARGARQTAKSLFMLADRGAQTIARRIVVDAVIAVVVFHARQFQLAVNLDTEQLAGTDLDRATDRDNRSPTGQMPSCAKCLPSRSWLSLQRGAGDLFCRFDGIRIRTQALKHIQNFETVPRAASQSPRLPRRTCAANLHLTHLARAAVL
jgi:hypothetical protein